MNRAVIVSATRTAIANFQGAFSQIPAPELGGFAVAEAVRRAGIDPASVGEVILGNVLAAGLGLNPARVAAIRGGIPTEVPSFGVNKACGSGLKAIALAAQAIVAGDAECIVAGGFENMTLSPYLLAKARGGYRMGHDQLIDSMIRDGLSCPLTLTHMGITAENVAAKYGISREAQDEFSRSSQAKAAAAQTSGTFDEEIFAVEVAQKKGDAVRVTRDEFVRPATTTETLARLSPVFQKNGSVTAGNASGINDGAAALVVMSEARAKSERLTPLAIVRGAASVGVDPAIMGMGPWPASEKLLRKLALAKEDIGLWELNEAYAAQSLGVLAELKIDPSRVNVNGGAIALGHPIGASGARVLVTLLHAMQKRGVSLGLASLCIGGGQGISLVVERA